MEARHIFERASASRKDVGTAEGELSRVASLIRVDLTAGRHAPQGRLRDARSHDDGNHRGPLHTLCSATLRRGPPIASTRSSNVRKSGASPARKKACGPVSQSIKRLRKKSVK